MLRVVDSRTPLSPFQPALPRNWQPSSDAPISICAALPAPKCGWTRPRGVSEMVCLEPAALCRLHGEGRTGKGEQLACVDAARRRFSPRARARVRAENERNCNKTHLLSIPPHCLCVRREARVPVQREVKRSVVWGLERAAAAYIREQDVRVRGRARAQRRHGHTPPRAVVFFARFLRLR